MAYIPVSPGEITSSSSVRCRIKDFSGGLCKTLSDLDIADNQLSFMSNMLASGAALAVRGGILENERLAGTFHSLLREEYGEIDTPPRVSVMPHLYISFATSRSGPNAQ